MGHGSAGARDRKSNKQRPLNTNIRNCRGFKWSQERPTVHPNPSCNEGASEVLRFKYKYNRSKIYLFCPGRVAPTTRNRQYVHLPSWFRSRLGGPPVKYKSDGLISLAP